MITELLLQEYKAHASTTIPLDRLTVLVGPNAVGKTSVLDALLLLSCVIDEPPQSLPRILTGKYDLRWLIRRGADREMNVRVRGTGGPSGWSFFLTAPPSGVVEQAAVNRSAVTSPAGSEKANHSKPSVSAARGKPPPKPPRIDPEDERITLRAARTALRGAVALRLETRRLAEPSYSDDENPRLAEDGYGLATTLSRLKLEDTARFLEMEGLVRRIVPRLKNIKFRRTKLEQGSSRTVKIDEQLVVVPDTRTVVADELLLDYEDASDLPAHLASEGTLLVLGILCAIFSPSRPNLILLDDLDRGLHPKAQAELLTGLRSALLAAPDLQIVATTHSPYLVDDLRPEELVFLTRGPDGVVGARRMTEHPKAAMLDVLTTGELWTSEGESWAAAQ